MDQPNPGRQPASAEVSREDPFGLIISVLLFGYFGFFAGLGTTTASGGPAVPLFVFFLWSLRVCGVGFAIALLLHFSSRGRASTLVAGVIGLLSAIAFLVAGVWDWLDTGLALAIAPVLLLLFAVWNGYVSWRSLQGVLPVR